MAKTAKKNLQTPPENEDLQQTLDVEPQIPSIVEDPPPLTPPDEPEAPAEEPEPPAPVEAEPFKRRPGRPSKTDPPVLRSGVIERINNLTSWEATRVYVYRWEPYTDRKAGGKQSVMVKRYDGPFDEMDVLEDPGLGSGVYEFVVNRTDPQTRMRKIIDSGVVRLLNMKYPPRIPAKEWVDDERNKDWEWARNISDKQTEMPAAKVAQADPLIEILRDQIKSQNDRMAEMHREMREAASPKKDPETQTLVAILAPSIPKLLERLLSPPPPAPADPTRDLFMTYLMKQLEIKAEVPKPKDAAEELEKVLDLQEKIETRLGGSRNGGRSRKTGWQEVISECTPPVAEALKPVFQIIAMGMAQAAQKGQQQANQQQQPPQQQQAPPPMIQQPPPIHEPPKPGPQLVEEKPTLEAIAAAVLQHLQQEKTGYQLGDWYIEEFGQDEFRDVRVQGKPQLLLALKDMAEWRDIFKFSESGALDEMLTEFFTWEPPDEDEEDDEDESPAANLDAINTGWTQPATVEAKQ